MQFIPSVIVVALAVFLASRLFSGVKVKSVGTVLLVGLVFGVLNLFIGWLVHVVVAVVLFPAAILTLGLPYLFLGFFVNCVLLWLTDKVLDDFEIKSFGSLLSSSALISLVGWLFMRMHVHMHL